MAISTTSISRLFELVRSGFAAVTMLACGTAAAEMPATAALSGNLPTRDGVQIGAGPSLFDKGPAQSPAQMNQERTA
jgi:hypothetical protein